jgi:hypothetical protein
MNELLTVTKMECYAVGLLIVIVVVAANAKDCVLPSAILRRYVFIHPSTRPQIQSGLVLTSSPVCRSHFIPCCTHLVMLNCLMIY